MDKHYSYAKLSDLNYRIAIHSGNAKKRLGSHAKELLLISDEIIPKQYKKDFKILIDSITNENLKKPIGMGITFSGKWNITVAKSIELLINVQFELEAEINDFKNKNKNYTK